jgi:hypothetical protein
MILDTHLRRLLRYVRSERIIGLLKSVHAVFLYVDSQVVVVTVQSLCVDTWFVFSQNSRN